MLVHRGGLADQHHLAWLTIESPVDATHECYLGTVVRRPFLLFPYSTKDQSWVCPNPVIDECRGRRAMGGSAAREEAGARPPHDHITYLLRAAATSMLAASMLVVGRAGRVGCVVCAGKGAEGESVLMMMTRTANGKAWAAGRGQPKQPA